MVVKRGFVCETQYFTLRKKWKLGVFENKIRRRIFGSKMDEKGEWRMLHNDELHNLYHSANIEIESRRLLYIIDFLLI